MREKFDNIIVKIRENKQMVFTICCLFILSLLIGGVSYAAYNFANVGENSDFKSGQVFMTYVEPTNEYYVKDALPIKDNLAMNSEDYFEFSVTSNALVNSDYVGVAIPYEVTITEVENNTLTADQVKLYLTVVEGDKEVAYAAPSFISELESPELSSEGVVVCEDMHLHKTETKTIVTKYRLRVWVDEEVDASNWNKTGEFQYKFRVNVNGETIPDYRMGIDSVKVNKVIDGASAEVEPVVHAEGTMMKSILPKTSSTIIYEAEVVNSGLTPSVLDYIYINQDNANIIHKIGGINTGDVLQPGEVRTITVEVEFWDITGSVTQEKVMSVLDFKFVPLTNKYSNECTLNWDGSSVSEPIISNIYGIDYYMIGNANELAWFANAVNAGNDSINAMLTNDICLNSKPFTSIGTTSYKGIFDGQNRTIYGYSFSQDKDIEDAYEQRVGLFGTNDGYVRNLNLVVDIDDDVYYRPASFTGNDDYFIYLGGMFAINTGLVSNVSVSGDIRGIYTTATNCSSAKPHGFFYIGGIAGQNQGVITSSFNKANIYIEDSLERNACQYSKYHDTYIGGITGDNYGFVSDAYNMANIENKLYIDYKNSNYYGRVGGLVGYIGSGEVKNSYSVGNVVYSEDIDASSYTVENMIGCAVGGSLGTVSNVFYENTCSYGGEGIAATRQDMRSPELDVEFFLGNYFSVDYNNINNLYPILKWQTK